MDTQHLDNTSDTMQQQSTTENTEIESVDYSEECSLDWDTFSFESEIHTRANIYKQNLLALKSMAESTALMKVEDEHVTRKLQADKDFYSELLRNNTNECKKYEALIKEYKTIKENIENLTAKHKSVEQTIKEFEEEESNSLKEYQHLKIAYQEGVETYSTVFNINITTEALTDTTYVATLNFGEKIDVGPIKFIVDRIKRKVIEFHANEVLLPEEEEDIRNKFDTLKNLPGLLCALHEIILKE